MKRWIILTILLFSVSINAQQKISWTPLLQQTSLYFASNRVTMTGFGIGSGVSVTWKQNLFAQGDINILWINGNAIATRLAVGYKRRGFWAPSIAGTFGILSGQRTEVLSRTGKRPAEPVWVIGLRGAPLRFENSNGFVSALEIGYGVGPYSGRSIELTILSAGINW
jgi:hypothetical protein